MHYKHLGIQVQNWFRWLTVLAHIKSVHWVWTRHTKLMLVNCKVVYIDGLFQNLFHQPYEECNFV